MDRDSGLGSGGWAVIGMALFSVAAVVADPVGAVLLAGLGVSALGLSIFRSSTSVRMNPLVLGGLLAVLVVIGSSPHEIARFSERSGSYPIYFVLAIATAGAAIANKWVDLRAVVTILAMIAVLVTSLATLIADWQPNLGSDVYQAHFAAGQALAEGENPYSDAVMFHSGNPFAPEETAVIGYPYPLPSLLTYGATATLTDPRLISLLAWIGIASALAIFAHRRKEHRDLTLGVLVLFAAIPGWRMSLFFGWTEPLSLGLLVGAVAGISRRRTWGWVLLGIALASKQYFVLVAPLLLLFRDDSGKRPGMISLATAAILSVAPAVLGPRDYVHAVVGNVFDIGFRPDTQSLNGLINQLGYDFSIPTMVALSIVALVTILVVRYSDQTRLWSIGVLTLAITFLTTSAFPNYWLLVAVLTGLSAVFCVPDDQDRRRDPAGPMGRAVDVPTPRDQVAEDSMPEDT